MPLYEVNIRPGFVGVFAEPQGFWRADTKHEAIQKCIAKNNRFYTDTGHPELLQEENFFASEIREEE